MAGKTDKLSFAQDQACSIKEIEPFNLQFYLLETLMQYFKINYEISLISIRLIIFS